MSKFPYKFLIISAIIFVTDQITKYAIWFTVQMKGAVSLYRQDIPFEWNYEPVRVLGDLFRFTHVQNTGAAFSFSIGTPIANRIFFSIFSLILIAVVFYMFNKAEKFVEKLCFAMIIGGAMGNTLDRFLLGSVTDFIDVDFPDVFMERWPIFNIADSSIVCAVIILLGWTLFFQKKEDIVEPLIEKKTEDKINPLVKTAIRGSSDDKS